MAAEPLAEGGAAGTAAAGGGGRLGMQFAGKQAEKEETQVIFFTNSYLCNQREFDKKLDDNRPIVRRYCNDRQPGKHQALGVCPADFETEEKED